MNLQAAEPGNPARIAILGAESTGKSTLAETLARRHRTLWVPEYLREFVDTTGRVPYEDDQSGIARTQRAREDACARELAGRPGALLFCDTAPLMTAVYSRFYWGRVPPDLLALEAAHDYALTLVAAPDLPWVADGLMRDSEDVRARVHATLLEVLDARGIAHVLVEGDLPQRVRQVEALLA
ncbi:AAA family ATPase [Massilia sp. 9096]|uniref:AAA family ATPase n=1 Tax=Massilia sp. 9096 TaxID=1500894 RepID=UPI00068F61FF|nr:ATP-binding protein [Massilia sp. 9096]